MILEKINEPNDIKKLDKSQLPILAEEIRAFLVDKVSKKGGHLASNLGVVELTMALHLCLDFPNDKIVWDVGHQSYTHKVLTGRKEGFDELRSYGGMSGFPKRRESKCDSFDTGHSSTSISAGLGIVTANQIKGDDSTVVSVIGDGAMTGGLAFEALNNAASINRNFIMILNDNEMSIAQNVGGLSSYLSGIRTGNAYNGLKDGVSKSLNAIPVVGKKLVHHIKKTKSSIKQLLIPGMLFENMGITYLGPVDGHNLSQLVRTINEAKKLDHAVIIHVLTKKGKGFEPAEKHPSRFHGVEPFNHLTGEPVKAKKKVSYTDTFSHYISKFAKDNEKIVAITAAMPDGTGLKRFAHMYPERFFDVGIAEEHAVTFAAGLASAGLKPYVAIYSSFLQRAYDQMIHDVCIQNLPVVFMIDRAGFVGGDGETHQGIFDLSYLNTIPNMNVCAPKNRYELADMIKYSTYYNGPIAIRYPRGEAYEGLKEYREAIVYGRAEVIYKEKDIALLAVGSMVKEAEKARELLKKRGYNVSLINARFVKPFDENCIIKLAKDHKLLVTIEENVLNGGFGEQVLRFVNSSEIDIQVQNLAIPNQYLEQGSVDVLRKEAGLDPHTIAERVENRYKDLM